MSMESGKSVREKPLKTSVLKERRQKKAQVDKLLGLQWKCLGDVHYQIAAQFGLTADTVRYPLKVIFAQILKEKRKGNRNWEKNNTHQWWRSTYISPELEILLKNAMRTFYTERNTREKSIQPQ